MGCRKTVAPQPSVHHWTPEAMAKQTAAGGPRLSSYVVEVLLVFPGRFGWAKSVEATAKMVMDVAASQY